MPYHALFYLNNLHFTLMTDTLNAPYSYINEVMKSGLTKVLDSDIAYCSVSQLTLTVLRTRVTSKPSSVARIHLRAESVRDSASRAQQKALASPAWFGQTRQRSGCGVLHTCEFGSFWARLASWTRAYMGATEPVLVSQNIHPIQRIIGSFMFIDCKLWDQIG